ncbi:hypothetical protein, partial [Escherichia coli]|uniref:hypothetical protein n=1 Tax=Escherichia coli TaxID=562 RepID=UPI001485A12D
MLPLSTETDPSENRVEDRPMGVFKGRTGEAGFVVHGAGIVAGEVCFLEIQNRILLIAALIARYRRLNALVNSRRHLSPVGAV